MRKCYDETGKLDPLFSVEAPEAIFECNAACKCHTRQCKNRVIQRATKIKVMLVKTRSRGWGVRTLEPLERGTFVGVYAGELITTGASYKRKNDTYLFNLAGNPLQASQEVATEPRQQSGAVAANQDEADEKAECDSKSEQFVCDAMFYGNFTRFINHSCEPNLVGIRSFTSHQDLRFPYIAFFTNTFIPRNSELTLNYGDNYWIVKCRRDGQFCLCKRPACKFSKKKFAG